MTENQRTISPGTEQEVKRRPLLVELFIRLVKEKPLGTIGGVIVLALFLTGVFADFLAPYGFNEISLTHRLSPPSGAHLLGADNLGRDLLSRIIYGARISMYVGLGATTIGIFFNLVIGTISGYFGGRIDLTIQRFTDAFMCIPFLFIILTIMSIVGPGLWQVIFIIGGIYGFHGGVRVIRSAVIGIKENMYVEAAKAIGSPAPRIMIQHMLPNIMPVVIITFTMRMGSAILMESMISFLGFGIPPPIPSWGGMLSGSGRQYMLLAPWMALWPGLALATVVYGVNMLGDALRDLLDPRLRGGLGRFGGVGKQKSKKAAQAGVTSQESSDSR